MSRLFGAYVVVDYSAAEGKKTGDSSMWIGVMKRDVRFRLSYETHNPATRAEGLALLRELLADLHKRGDRILLAVNFPLGLPRGTAERLKLDGEPWRAVWDFLAKNIVDKPDNSNNRFQVAAKINRLMTDAAYPFWGCPKNAAQKWLSTLKPDSYGEFPEYRLTEEAVRARKLPQASMPKSLWQMHGAGVAGGTAMLGITALRTLVAELGEAAKIWPFQTGFEAQTPDTLAGLNTLVVEVHPPLFDGVAEAGEMKDAASVRLTAQGLADLDDKGQLGAAFAAPKLDEAQRLIAAQEEGWILGL
ncbi:cobalamin biosynthesis protein CbiG [Asticcacaulis sp. EMRT-3]|uniref:cobalamin biosynthesis protein CbiG n=1 Tax=Asticcacaulis sp. EMRT-3 TaxID=3040349 RepID=UPI0024AEEE50|nr:cobalamin biosynthesis protein CbiG [Asticcacaulis sp. EMRT-3]MDI7774253.1 cobalamin biosynthesis protein CbiG [Asticcacaulis sp. EMRT-3]